MLKNKKKMKQIFLSLSLLSIILIGLFSASTIAITYNLTLTKGTETSEVMPYDEETWGKTVKNWFQDEAGKSGAKSKTTTLAYYTTSWDLYNIFTRYLLFTLFDPDEVYPVIGVVAAAGYDKEKINSTYTKEYPLWCAVQAKWYFITGEFNETANSTFSFLPIFQDPTHFRSILDDYNRLARTLNSDFLIRYLGISFPIYTADEFLWNLVLHGLTIPSPSSDYLNTLVNTLRCSNNVEVNGNVLTFIRQKPQYHTVEVTFGLLGTQSSFVVKNNYGQVVYQIITTHSSTLVYIILGIIAICLVGIAFYHIKRKKSLKMNS